MNDKYGNIKGTLEVGKLADMVVLSKDLLRPNPKDIVKTEVVFTIVPGTFLVPFSDPFFILPFQTSVFLASPRRWCYWD